MTTTALPPHTPIWKCGMAQSRQTSTDNMQQSGRPPPALSVLLSTDSGLVWAWRIHRDTAEQRVE